MSKKVVAYLRVSTDAQTEKYGLDLQKSAIVQKANTDNVRITEWYVDGGYSGSTLERPGMQRLIADVKADKISKIYVFKLDRLSRDTIDTLTLLNRVFPQHNAKVVSTNENIGTETPDDRFMLGIHAEFAEHERAIFFQRSRAGRIERAKRGLWPSGGGTTPYGYRYDRNDGLLHVIPEQAENVRKIFELYNSGRSVGHIKKMVGVHSEPLVRNILSRQSYTGKIKYLGKIYQGLHEPIISEEVFEEAQENMRRRTNTQFSVKPKLLTNLCFCGKCGSRMRYQSWGTGKIKLVCYARYASSQAYMKHTEHCDCIVRAEPIEREVEACFQEFAIKATDCAEAQSNRAFLEAEIKKANKKLRNLYGLYGDNPNDNLLSVINEEAKRKESLQVELESEDEKSARPKKRKELRHVADIWEELSTEEKNRVLKMCVDKIVIADDDVNIYFDL